MDEWELPLEESGAFEHPAEENPSPADAGWKDELNLAEFPIAALDRSDPRRPDDPGLRGPARAAGQPAHRPPADDHGDPQARPADLAGRRGPGRPDPADQAAEQLHRRQGPVLALRADRAPGLAAERAELSADRGGAAPLGRRGPDVRERLVGQRRQELGRRAVPRPRQRHPLRSRAVADRGPARQGRQGGTRAEPGPRSPPCPSRASAGTR